VLGAKIPTHGNGGWEAFEIDGRTFIAAANFWDGESVDMSALSKVYRVSLNETGKLLLKRHQSMRTRGAHGWDFFESGAEKLLVVPNYYQCGDTRRQQEPGGCLSTVVYRWMGKKFKEAFRIAAEGPGQTDHFHWKNSTFLIVAENFAQQISIYRIEGAEGSKSNRFPEAAMRRLRIHLNDRDRLQHVPCRSLVSRCHARRMEHEVADLSHEGTGRQLLPPTAAQHLWRA